VAAIQAKLSILAEVLNRQEDERQAENKLWE
jgi:hypothetical protein